MVTSNAKENQRHLQFWGIMFWFVDEFQKKKKKSLQKMQMSHCKGCLHSQVFPQPSEYVCQLCSRFEHLWQLVLPHKLSTK